MLTAMTYVEGASLHQERAGSTVFARYAFNELWSFIAGWAVLLDFLILIAVTAFVATHYMAAFWAPLGERRAGARRWRSRSSATSPSRNIRGVERRPRHRARLGARRSPTSSLQLLIIVLGALLVVDIDALTESIDLGTSPRWEDLLFALTVSTVAFTSLESAVGAGRRGRASAAAASSGSIASATASVLVIYVGISLVAVAALPITPGASPLTGDALNAPGARDRRRRFDPPWLADVLRYVDRRAGDGHARRRRARARCSGCRGWPTRWRRNRQIPSVDRAPAPRPRRRRTS